MEQFSTASRRGHTAVTNDVDVAFLWDDVEMVAHPPTTGQLALFLASQGKGNSKSLAGLFDLLSEVLEPEHWALIERELRDGVDAEMCTEVVRYLIGEWTGRPTTPRSGSPTSRKPTGTSSTAKPRRVGSASSR
jgi:hypothetical protein